MKKIIRRRYIILASFIIAAAQIISILVYQAGFSFAPLQASLASLIGSSTSVDMTVFVNNTAPYSSMTLNGTEVFKANVSPQWVMLTSGTSAPLAGVSFYLVGSTTVGLTAANDGTNWIANLSMYSSLADGSYDFYAKAFYGSGYEATAESQHYTVILNRGGDASVNSAPSAPSGLMLNGTPTSTSIPLRWTNNSTNEDKFNIGRKLSTSGTFTDFPQLMGSGITTYTDTTAAPGTSYIYHVQACREGYGCSAYAESAVITSAANSAECSLTVSLSPNTPAAQGISAGQTGVSLVKFNLLPNCAITLNSFAVSLLPMPSGYSNISSLRLYKDGIQLGSSMSVTGASVNFAGLNTAIAASQTIVFEARGDINTSATSGSTVYGVFGGSSATGSSGSVGNNASGNIIAGNVMTIAASSMPSSPSYVTALSETGKIVVSWPASASATKYSVYKRVSSDGATWGSYQTPYMNITTPYYHDTNVTAGNYYQYQVAGCDASICSTTKTESGSVIYSGGNVSCTGLTLTLNDADTTYAASYNDPVNFTWTCTPGGIASNVYLKVYKSSDGTLALSLPNGPANIGTETRYLSTSSLSVGSYILKACFDSNCATATASQTFTVVSGTSTPAPTSTPTSYLNAWIDMVPYSSSLTSLTIISGVKNAGVTSNSSFPAGTLNFYLYKLSSDGTSFDFSTNYYTSTGGNISLVSGSVGMNWTGTINTSNLANGTYKFFARDTSSVYTSNYVYFAVNNSTSGMPTPTPTVVPYSTPVPTTPYLYAWIDSVTSAYYAAPTIISGTKLASITSNSSFPSGSLTFYLYKYSSGGVVDTAKNYYTSTTGNIALASGSGGMNWTGTINTGYLSDGNYKFYAEGYVNGITTGTKQISNYVYFAVNNTATATPAPTPTSAIEPTKPTIAAGIDSSISGSIVSGTRNIWAKSDLPLTGLTFKFYNTASGGFTEYLVSASPSSTIVSGTVSGGFNYWSGVLDTAKLPNGSYKLIAKGVYNGYAYENIIYFYFNVNNPVASTAPMVSPVFSPTPTILSSPYPATSPTVMPIINYIPIECQQKGYTTPEACQQYMQFPPECRSANILDPIKCQEYMFKYAMPQICSQQGATTQEECSKIILLNSFPQQCKDANITDEARCLSFMAMNTFLTIECKEANISDPQACGNYMAEKFMPKECIDGGAKTKEECDYIMRTKYGNFAAQTTIEINMMNPLAAMGGVSPECQEQNIIDPAACEKIMIAKYMPEDCKAANITTKEGCEKFLFEKNAPKECIDAKISTPKDCEVFMFKRNAPQDCVDAGMFNPEACKKFMFEKYGDKGNIPLDKFPVECQKAGAKSIDECEKIMTQSYLPGDCKKNAITDSGQCDIYLKQKYMPEECRAAGVKTQKECDAVMFKKFAPQECKKAGIEGEKECKDYLFNLYAPKATCQGLDEWQCKNTIKENHLGAISSKQADYAKVKTEIASLAGGAAVKTEALREKMGDSKQMIPIKDNGASLKIIKTEENLVLNKDNDLIQTASAAVMVDSDDDGLTDDMEQRIGTDTKNPDTDSDGYKDSDEVKAGYNPLGEGKLAEGKIAPIDEAILNDQVLSHPKIAGVESDEYSFDKVVNIEPDQNETGGAKYRFTGKAAGNSVVTLYVYSDLPIVMTVKTDEYGNWNYEFDKSIMDGEHEAYVVLNDNSGKVVARSSVMNFFVKEAKAISVKDFVSPASASEAPLKESEKSMNNYMLMTAGIILAGLIIFIGYIFIIKKRNQTPKA